MEVQTFPPAVKRKRSGEKTLVLRQSLNAQTGAHTSILLEELSSFFCRKGFDLRGFRRDFFTTEDREVAGGEREKCFPALEEEEDGEDEGREVGVIFFISATRAEARFFTMASRSE